MDLYIADTEFLGKGYGPQILRAFMDKLISDYDLKRFIIDPQLENEVAIRTYQKVGFKVLKEGLQPYGKVLWMEKVIK